MNIDTYIPFICENRKKVVPCARIYGNAITASISRMAQLWHISKKDVPHTRKSCARPPAELCHEKQLTRARARAILCHEKNPFSLLGFQSAGLADTIPALFFIPPLG